MNSCDFKEMFRTFVYETVYGVQQTFIAFQPYGLDVIFLEYPSKENPPLCVRLVCWRLMCVFVVHQDWTVAQTSRNHFDMAMNSP